MWITDLQVVLVPPAGPRMIKHQPHITKTKQPSNRLHALGDMYMHKHTNMGDPCQALT
jgi:hypothetical protein